MKRTVLALMGGLLYCTMAMAQIGGFTQRGKVVQEFPGWEPGIAHPSLPINSKAMVLNTWNEKEIEVTVIGRIAASGSRIASLTQGAWEALELTPETEVVISAMQRLPPPEPSPAVPEPPPPPVMVVPPPPTVIYAPPVIRDRPLTIVVQMPKPAPQAVPPQPLDITVHNSATPPAKSAPAVREPANSFYNEYMQRLVSFIFDTWDKASPDEGTVSSAPAARDSPAKVKVFPGLPDPSGNQRYRLQVGVFSTRESLYGVLQLLRSSGFSVDVRHETGTEYRVDAVDVPAAMVSHAVDRLGHLGITELRITQ